MPSVNTASSMPFTFLSTNLYERQGAAQTNFTMTMPKAEGDLAQEYFKDPYRFEFAQLKEEHTEQELKDEFPPSPILCH